MIIQLIGCCLSTCRTLFPSATSWTISITLVKSGKAIVLNLECTRTSFTRTSKEPKTYKK